MCFMRAFILMLLGLSTVYAGSLDIRLSDDSAQFEYFKRSDISIGAGGSDLSYGLFYNDNSDLLLTGNLLAAGNIQGTSRAFNAAVGGKIYLGRFDDLDDDFLGALAIGGKLSYVVPSNTPMAVYFEAYVAPEITSFADIEGLLDWEIGFEIEVAPSASVYVGYRELEAELKNLNTDYELDDAAHVGLRFTF